MEKFFFCVYMCICERVCIYLCIYISLSINHLFILTSIRWSIYIHKCITYTFLIPAPPTHPTRTSLFHHSQQIRLEHHTSASPRARPFRRFSRIYIYKSRLLLGRILGIHPSHALRGVWRSFREMLQPKERTILCCPWCSPGRNVDLKWEEFRFSRWSIGSPLCQGKKHKVFAREMYFFCNCAWNLWKKKSAISKFDILFPEPEKDSLLLFPITAYGYWEYESFHTTF